MMSVPAINSVLPSSGSQPSKIGTTPTANPSVSPIGLSVQSKLSVIPPQIPTNPNKPPVGVNHSSVPLSLVYESKVLGSQAQSSLTKPSGDKPKDLSPSKPTSNGVEASITKTSSSHTQQPQSSSSVPSSKPEEASVQQTNSNHSDERIPSTSNEPTTSENQEPAQNVASQPQNPTADKKEESSKQNISKEGENNPEAKGKSEEQASKDEPEAGTSTEKTEAKTAAPQTKKRKRERKPREKKEDEPEPEPEPEKKSKRIRSQVLPYQSPLPELATLLSKALKEKDTSSKNSEDRLIVFYKNEFLAVRNAEGGFYLCQTIQNVYRSTHRIRIRWLSQEKEKSGDDGDIYTPDFYDFTDFECILTTVDLSKKDKNMYKLRKLELERIENILKRALDVEKGVTEKPSITEEHPDGIDLSLYKDESQLQKPKKAIKRKRSSSPGKSPKQARRDDSGEGETKAKSPRKAKGKSRTRKTRKVTKTSSDKGKTGKRGGGRSEPSKSSKTVDQLKVSPPNEKARVVAKVLRKVDIVPVKETPMKKKGKLKAAKRSPEASSPVKTEKKKILRNAKKPNQEKEGGDKEEPTQSHHERRQGKNKYSNNKTKKN